MSLVAKSVVKNKFWIVEEGGNKVATIQKNEQDVVWVSGHQRQKFPNIDLLKNHYNIVFDRPQRSSSTNSNSAYGYPTATVAHNVVWDLKNQVPLYTQDRRSKCHYAAGWYVLNDQVVFCPKSIYINRNIFSGPYRTREEAVNEQNNINAGSTKILRKGQSHESDQQQESDIECQ
jgi:hypothetical protein